MTFLVISKSTISNAVILSVVKLLFDLFVSLSEPVTVTKLEKLPDAITSAIIVRL